MKLCEFDTSRNVTALVSVTNHLRARYLEAETDSKLGTDAYVQILKRNGISVTKEYLYDLVQQAPLSNLITDISDKFIVFKGQEDQTYQSPGAQERSEETVDDLASSANKSMLDAASKL
jgi:hypothetical protein